MLNLPSQQHLQVFRQLGAVAALRSRVPCVGCAARRRPRAMAAAGLSALLASALLLLAGSGLPHPARGRPLEPAAADGAASKADRVWALSEFGKLGSLRMYSG